MGVLLHCPGTLVGVAVGGNVAVASAAAGVFVFVGCGVRLGSGVGGNTSCPSVPPDPEGMPATAVGSGEMSSFKLSSWAKMRASKMAPKTARMIKILLRQCVVFALSVSIILYLCFRLKRDEYGHYFAQMK